MPSTFYSDTVESALQAARAALGEETMLLEAGASPAEELLRGSFRVVAMGPEEVFRNQPACADGTVPNSAPDALNLGRLWRELRSMRESLDSVGAVAARTALDHSALSHTPELAPWVRRLLDAEFPAAFVHSIIDSTARRLRSNGALGGSFSAPGVRRAVTEEIESRTEVRPGFGKDSGNCRVLALAGPAGSGKTTTLAKLATTHGVTGRKRAAILSLDVFRIGAAEQLRCLAGILGVPFRLCETPMALRRALEDTKDKDVVFIDTPGAGPAELEWWQGWAPRLVAEPSVEVQIVLPATASCRQLSTWIREYRQLKPGRLIFTHVDEAATFGNLVWASCEAQLPISYLANGQGIPEDLEPATQAHLVGLVIGDAGALVTAA